MPRSHNSSWDELTELSNEIETVEREPLTILRKIYSYSTFREGQKEVIDSITSGKDTIALLPTCGGKSVIYVTSAVFMSGITIVVEPLKALMEEQVVDLRNKHVISFFNNSTMSQQQRTEIIAAILNPKIYYSLVFTSPEVLKEDFMIGMMSELSKQKRLHIVAVDEAHCIDLWGGSFRASYSDMKYIKEFNVPILALSGSATDKTVSVIKDALKMDDPAIFRSSFARNNLSLNVEIKQPKPFVQIAQYIQKMHFGERGIVYCNKQEHTKDIAYILKQNGITATFVHAGMRNFERKHSEQLWKDDKCLVICATKCFGMGIDKPNVNFVIHAGFPESMEDFYQQIGRAGRDGNEAKCTLFFSYEDRTFHLQNLSDVEDIDEREVKSANLNKINQYSMQTSACRHRIILSYFGEESEDCKERCDVCSTVKDNALSNQISEAKIVLECFTSMKTVCNHVTTNLLLNTLLGSESADVKSRGLDKTSKYGAAKEFSISSRKRKKYVQKLLLTMVTEGILEEVFHDPSTKSKTRSKKSISSSKILLELRNIDKLCSTQFIVA